MQYPYEDKVPHCKCRESYAKQEHTSANLAHMLATRPTETFEVHQGIGNGKKAESLQSLTYGIIELEHSLVHDILPHYSQTTRACATLFDSLFCVVCFTAILSRI